MGDAEDTFVDAPRGRFVRRELAVPVSYRVPEDHPVDGTFTALRLFHHEGRAHARAELVLSLSLGAYQRAQDAGLFRLSLTSVAPGDGFLELYDDQPIELELSPGPIALGDLGAPLDAAADQLIAELPSWPPERLTWRRVMQRQAPVGGVSLMSGQSSIYLDDDEAEDDIGPLPGTTPPSGPASGRSRRVTRW